MGLADYPHCYWLAAEKDGYSGVGLMCRTEPLSVQFGFPAERGGEQHNAEGRLITAEFQAFYLVTTYVPNAGRGLVTLDKRMDWDPLLRQHCQVGMASVTGVSWPEQWTVCIQSALPLGQVVM